ncbi:MAG: helix-turn-helix transcriptional regulator [Thermodesulfovibrionia bacterium]|nr:helix-turn-helix transcriptional regulator [Thermodesulfovibrionia bacterium]
MSKDKDFKLYFDKAEAKRNIAQEIAALRRTNHLTQAQLAEKVGTRQQVISRMESPNDNRMPSLDFLAKIAKIFNRRLVISLLR